MSAYVDRFGLDPEVAIVSKKTGKGRSAHLFVDGLKQFEFTTEGDTKYAESIMGSEYERDGAAIEVRSIVHSACRDNVIPYLAEALRQAQLDVEKQNKLFTLSSTPKFELDHYSLKGEVPADVTEFGCRPDIDAYSLQPKDPVCAKTDMRRWTGGHIHASCMNAMNDVEQQAALALLFDYCVALPFVAMLGEAFAEGEAERRTMYGQAGSFRYDDGLDKMEFRTLSGRLLVSPIMLGWALGMVKGMIEEVPSIQTGNWDYTSDFKSFILDTVVPVIDPGSVQSIINNHDVEGARTYMSDIIKSLPNYKENDQVLGNPIGGGGGGTTNPYFFLKTAEAMLVANDEGVTFKDDMQFTWGLYENYEPKHHAYWGVQAAFAGLCDEDIFPQRPIVQKLWPTDKFQKSVIYTHPINGGAKRFTTRAAAGWLA